LVVGILSAAKVKVCPQTMRGEHDIFTPGPLFL
jgi:hypothetical protein